MRKIVNECVGCPPEIGCYGDSCPYTNVTRYYCDRCGKEAKLYLYYGEELCEECLLDNFDVIEGSE